MSENHDENRGSASKDGGSGAGAPGAASRTGPQPEPIRFFGTTWVGHDGGYALRRAAVAVGSVASAAAGCLVLRFAHEGLVTAQVGGFVNTLVIVMFAVCSAVAFRKTWEGFTRRPADPSREESLRSLKAIGFIGSLLAYFVRSLTEAPGEKLLRGEYETALRHYEKRRTTRSDPAARRKPKRR
ncbi:hypothetical protein ACFU5O_21600 [Streptomyces sp. NPDC057445]|uniref:hypothetical protein n=1 Tax=Streptomyces sp. NPDC057445 TaxID=3346136 RepID=UPI0036914E70